LLKGKKKPGRDTLYWHLPHYWGPDNCVDPYSAMRQGDWKLIHWYEDDRVELYSLEDDLSEENDKEEEP